MRLFRALTITLTLAAFAATGVGATEALGDAEAGKQVFLQCKGCHEVGQGARDRIGPHLNGIFGRQAAAHEGFSYSKSMQRAGVDGVPVYDEERRLNLINIHITIENMVSSTG